MYILHIKTWLTFLALTILRVVHIFSGGSWFQSRERCDSETEPPKTSDCLGKYNEAVMDPIADFFFYALHVLVAVSIVLSLLCFKWRWIAGYFLYLECLIRICAVCFPNQSG